jgi:hypothetical protein
MTYGEKSYAETNPQTQGRYHGIQLKPDDNLAEGTGRNLSEEGETWEQGRRLFKKRLGSVASIPESTRAGQ